ncbi:hypothetical protein HHI36_008422 [Cryptolaemus montrouzieri]|uniref:Uncharacterized protein n=1 Tax=Cryptolaemus montrouzieri TaxID=559131 RepID=A0ABD2MSJ3_9CUCU
MWKLVLVKKKECKSAFISLYGITAKRCRRLIELRKENKIPQDLRGKALGSRSNVVSGEYSLEIHNFIESLEKKEINYSNDVEKLYLSSFLNIKKLHEMFLNGNPEIRGKVNYRFFRKYFNVNFDLSFGRPQIDVCNPHLNDGAKRTATAELLVHKRRASKFYKKVKEIEDKCANNETDLALYFDYMQNLPLPTLPVQDFFIINSAGSINCIHNMKTGKDKH